MKKVILILALIATNQFAFAQEKSEDAQQPVCEQMAQLQLASDLAKYGYETYSASALIEAARILNDVPSRELVAESVVKGEGELGAKSKTSEFTVEQLLKDARLYAEGDATLRALADRIIIDNGVSRGRVGGAMSHKDCVRANTRDIYEVRFIANELAEVLVIGDGDTDLDLYIYDSNGNLIKKDDDYSDTCYCSWKPLWTGSFTIEILNRGNVCNYYSIFTN